MSRRLQLGLALFSLFGALLFNGVFGFSYCSIILGGSAIDNVNVSTNASVSSDKCVYFGSDVSGQIAVNQSEGSLTSGNISITFGFPDGISVSNTSASISGTSLNISDSSFSWSNASSKTIDFSYTISGSASGKFNVTIYYNGTINGTNVTRSILLDPVFGLGSYQVYINLTNGSDGTPINNANVSLIYGGNGSNLANGTTNSSGAAVFTGISANNYKVNASKTNFVYNLSSNFSVVENMVYNHTISPESTKPSVTATAPADRYFSNVTNVTFNWTATDNVDTNLTCNFSTNSTNGSSTIQTFYGYNAFVAYENLSEGAYKWNVTCFDDAPTPNNASTSNRTFYVDLTKPTISEVNVTSNSGAASVRFVWNTSEITWWRFYFDLKNGTITTQELTTLNTSSFDITITNLVEWSNYDYTLVFTDRAGNSANASGNFKTKGGAWLGNTVGTSIETDALADPNENVSFIIRAIAGIKEGEELVLDFGGENIVLNRVLITPNITSDRFRIEARELIFAPPVAELNKLIYKYFEVKVIYLDEEEIVKARVEAAVPREWVDSRRINKRDVGIFRYSNGSWRALNTLFYSEDVEKYYFTSFVPGFSYFAIGRISGNNSEEFVGLNQTNESLDDVGVVGEISGGEVGSSLPPASGEGSNIAPAVKKGGGGFVKSLKFVGKILLWIVVILVVIAILYIIIRFVLNYLKNRKPKNALYGY